MYLISLNPQEERLAQLLTRDAWVYFSDLISRRQTFHVKDIPMMPRGGSLELPDDLEIAQYYVDQAICYQEELALYGIQGSEFEAAHDGLVDKVESATGVRRGMADTGLANG